MHFSYAPAAAASARLCLQRLGHASKGLLYCAATRGRMRIPLIIHDEIGRGISKRGAAVIILQDV